MRCSEKTRLCLDILFLRSSLPGGLLALSPDGVCVGWGKGSVQGVWRGELGLHHQGSVDFSYEGDGIIHTWKSRVEQLD